MGAYASIQTARQATSSGTVRCFERGARESDASENGVLVRLLPRPLPKRKPEERPHGPRGHARARRPSPAAADAQEPSGREAPDLGGAAKKPVPRFVDLARARLARSVGRRSQAACVMPAHSLVAEVRLAGDAGDAEPFRFRSWMKTKSFSLIIVSPPGLVGSGRQRPKVGTFVLALFWRINLALTNVRNPGNHLAIRRARLERPSHVVRPERSSASQRWGYRELLTESPKALTRLTACR